MLGILLGLLSVFVFIWYTLYRKELNYRKGAKEGEPYLTPKQKWEKLLETKRIEAIRRGEYEIIDVDIDRQWLKSIDFKYNDNTLNDGKYSFRKYCHSRGLIKKELFGRELSLYEDKIRLKKEQEQKQEDKEYLEKLKTLKGVESTEFSELANKVDRIKALGNNILRDTQEINKIRRQFKYEKKLKSKK